MRPLVCLVDFTDCPLWTKTGVETGVLEDCAQVSLIHLDETEKMGSAIFEADALIVSHFPQITDELLRKLLKTRVTVRNGVGFDNVDIAAASKLGILVRNVPDYGTEEVSQTTPFF